MSAINSYQKLPVIVQAIQFTPENEREIVDWLGIHYPTRNQLDEGVLLIHTLEGTMQANYTDWIIKGIKGEFYPCKDDIFRATYKECEK